jgi:hypothetical protein
MARLQRTAACAVAATLALVVTIDGSSHREAPGIAKTPKLDGTDFYMFRSYEPGREGFVTLVANYYPGQEPGDGPNHYTLDPAGVYEIMIDNNGNAVEDITFQLRPSITSKDITVSAGGVQVAVPLINVGPIGPGRDDTANLNREETYSLTIVRGERRSGVAQPITRLEGASSTFKKPVDNIGCKSIPQYDTYARDHIYNIAIPGCGNGRAFVGQRKDSFVVNLPEIMDLVNFNPLGPETGEKDFLANKNITSMILEVPISCLTQSPSQPIIGGWTTSSIGVGAANAGAAPCPTGQPTGTRPADSGSLRWVPNSTCTGYVPDNHPDARSSSAPPSPGTQVSRLGSPLVNEIVIGFKDKDLFNSAVPTQDGALAVYVTNPTVPELLEILFPSVKAPNNFPRNDLVAAFLTGIAGVIQPPGIVPSEMLRLNTSIAATPMASQSRLGMLGSDNAGFPNGRRPGDDVVDIELRVEMGVLCHAFPGKFGCTAADAPSGNLPFTDGVSVDSSFFDNTFPYLKAPLRGSPNGTGTH